MAAPLVDPFKLTVELAGTLPSSLRWEPLFDGYGSAPDLDLFGLFAVAHQHINYVCHGENSWPGSRRQIMRHILDSRTWDELFDLSRIKVDEAASASRP